MRLETRQGKVIAVLEKGDPLRDADQAMALLAEAFSHDSQGFVIPKDMILPALPLLKGDLQLRITARYGHLNPKIAIAGRLPKLLEGMVKGYVEKAGLSASLLLCDDEESALQALSG